jgi:hypothetical protein
MQGRLLPPLFSYPEESTPVLGALHGRPPG